jgi:hypothetical protein
MKNFNLHSQLMHVMINLTEWNGDTDYIDEEHENEPMFQGQYKKSRQTQMLQMMNIMVNIGWIKEIVNETNLNAC